MLVLGLYISINKDSLQILKMVFMVQLEIVPVKTMKKNSNIKTNVHDAARKVSRLFEDKLMKSI